MPYAYAEPMHQELLHALSICIRKLCVHHEHMHQVLMRARAQAPSNMLSIMSEALSLRMRN